MLCLPITRLLYIVHYNTVVKKYSEIRGPTAIAPVIVPDGFPLRATDFARLGIYVTLEFISGLPTVVWMETSVLRLARAAFSS